jgi:hypothetical protein
VSFGTYARKVRDATLPYRRRVSAFRSCVQLYQPIGFDASLSFLEEIAGPFQRDEASLLRALDALTASREDWQAEVREYAAMRAGGPLTLDQRQMLTDCSAELRRQHTQPDLWSNDQVAYFRVLDLRTVASLMETAADAD